MSHRLIWSADVYDEEVYRIAKDPGNPEHLRMMDQILNIDKLENIERMFSPNEIRAALPYISFRPSFRRDIIETALSYWERGIHHAYPPAELGS